MSNQYLKLRRSAVPGRIPTTSSIEFGEIALNTYDGKAYMKKSGSSGEEIIIIGSTSGSFTGSFSGSFTGSLFGTASWANNATTSSYILQAVSASFALTASYVSSNFQYEVHVSGIDGNDTTGNGDLLNPVATIGKALLLVSASVASTDRRTIIVHPGTYIENITINTTNTYFFSTGVLGANCLISGSVTISAATRMSGIKMTNLIVSSSNPIYINNCAVDKQMTVSGSGYLEVQNTSLQCTSGIQVVGPASSGVIFENCSLYPLTVNNASAAVYVISCNQAITPTLTAGALTITRSTISSLTSGATSTALTTAAGSVLVLESCNVYNSLLTSHAAITANGFYSIKNVIYNRSASTLASLSGTGGPLATVSQFQYINADNINSTQGLTVTGSVIATQGFTGSLFGTASWAQNAITSSYVLNAVSASFSSTASSADNFLVRGTLTAQTIVAQVITSSTDFVTGSTKFGSQLSNTHQFTGSVSITGSLTVVGPVSASSFTGSLFGTASFATSASQATSSSFATTASYALNVGAGSGFPFSGSAVITGSLLISGSGLTVTGSTNLRGTTNVVGATSITGNTNVTGSLITTGTILTDATISDYTRNNRILKPKGGVNIWEPGDTSPGIGAIKIQGLYSDVFHTVKVRIRDANRNSFIVTFGGYYLTDTTTWTNSYAYIEGDANQDLNFNVRFGSIGDAPAVYIGEFSTNWGAFSPDIYVEEVSVATTGNIVADQTLTIGFETSTFENITSTISNTNAHNFARNGSSIYYNSGSVGIGNNSPSFSLDVSGSGRFTNSLQVTGSLRISGSQSLTGSLGVLGSVSASSFTGSLLGTASTASFVTTAQTASFVVTAQTASFVTGSNVRGPLGTNSILSSSFAISASWAPNTGGGSITVGDEGTTQGTATYFNFIGAGVTATVSSNTASITIPGGSGPSFNTATGSYGSFYSTQTQTNVAGTARSMSLNVTDITNGVSISGSTDPFNTYIKTENAGVYNIQFSAQVDKTDSGTDEIWIWIRKNGTNLSDTATSLQLVGNGAHYVAAWNFFVNAAANDYFQLMWYSPDANVRLHAEPAFGVVPGIPSLIVTANRVDQFLSNTGSFSGSFTGSLFGTASWAQNAVTASYVLNAVSASFATSASFSTTASFALNAGGGSSAKAGSGSAASFTGTPRSSSVTFQSAFSDNLYAVTVTGEDARSFTIQSKSSTGFTINSNSSVALTGPVYWIATAFN